MLFACKCTRSYKKGKSSYIDLAIIIDDAWRNADARNITPNVKVYSRRVEDDAFLGSNHIVNA